MSERNEIMGILINNAMRRRAERRGSVAGALELGSLYGGSVLVVRREDGSVSGIHISFPGSEENVVPPARDSDLDSIDC